MKSLTLSGRSILVVVLSLLAHLASALEPAAVAGPFTVTRGSGAVKAETFTIDLPDGLGGWRLRVDNDPAHPVTSADITIGGASVFRPTDFASAPARLERAVAWGCGSSKLAVTVRSAIGTSLRVSLMPEECWTWQIVAEERFTRSTGQPQTITRTLFTAGGSALLQVTNGDGHGRDAVSSAVICIDGREVFSPNDFNQQVQALTADASLKPTSRLTVQVRGSPGSYLTIRVLGVDSRTLATGFATSSSIVAEGAQPDIAVRLNRPYPRAVTAWLTLQSGTAVAGSDLTLAAGTVIFPVGETSVMVPVTINDDAVPEPTERATLRLTAVSSGVIDCSNQHTISITDNDPAIPVVEWLTSSSSVDEDSTYIVISLQVDRTSPQPIEMAFDLGGTATKEVDYQLTNQPLIIAPGQTRLDVRVFVLADALNEPDETIRITLRDPLGAVLGSRSVHTTTIRDGHCGHHGCGCVTLPTLAWTVAGQAIGEGAGSATATLKLGKAVAWPVTVAWRAGGTADRETDVFGLAARGVLTIPAGATSALLNFSVRQDTLTEATETITLTLEDQAGATLIAPEVHTVSILDDDQVAVPTVAFAAASSAVVESIGTATIRLTIGPASTQPLVVMLQVSGTATVGADVGTIPDSITIPAGSTFHDLRLTIQADAISEPAETVALTLGVAAGAVSGTPSVHTLTILDDDPLPRVSFASAASRQGEDAGATVLGVVLDHPSSTDITVPVAVTSGTATVGTAIGSDVDPLPAQVVIPAGSLGFELPVFVRADAVVEPDEILVLSLGSPTGATLGSPTTHTLTIVNDDVLPTVVWDTVSSQAGEAAGFARPRLRLSAPAAVPVIVSLVRSGSAGDADASVLSEVTIPVGASHYDVPITIVNDLLHEESETVVLRIAAISGAGPGSEVDHTLAIADDDAVPTLGFVLARSEAAESAASADVAVRLSAVSGVPAFAVVLRGGTAGAGDATVVGTVMIPAGASEAVIPVRIFDDRTDEPDETIDLTLTSLSGPGALSVHTLTILDDDAPPSVAFAAASASAAESSGAVPLIVRLSAVSERDVRVTLARSGTAGPGDAATPTQVVIPAGSADATLLVLPIDDALFEGDETVVLDLAAAEHAVITAPSSAVITIADDDAAPKVGFRLASSSVPESAGGFTVAVDLSAVSGREISVEIQRGGTAGPSDATLAITTVRIPTGVTSAVIPLTVVDDTTDEPDETVLLSLVTPVGATLADTITHQVSIIDDDASPLISFAVASSTVTEGVGGGPLLLKLDQPSGRDVAVMLLRSGSATDADAAVALELVIPAGASEAQVVWSVIDDALHEGDEALVLSLNQATHATIGNPEVHTVTIRDDDPLPKVSFAVATATIEEGQGVSVLQVRLSAASGLPVTVGIVRSGSAGDADALTPASVTIPAGALSRPLPLAILQDDLDELDESVILAISTVEGAIAAAPEVHTLTILDDDEAPTLAFATDAMVVEEGVGTAVVTLRLSAPSSLPVTVELQRGGDAGPDDATVATQAVIAPGLTSAEVAIVITQDALDEVDETLMVTVARCQHARLAVPGSVAVTIRDDDAPPQVAFAADTGSVGEGQGATTIALRLSAPSARPVTVTLGRSGTADAADANALVSVVIPPGQDAPAIPLTIFDDLLDERDETLVLTLLTADHAGLGERTVHTLTIVDDDATPTIAFAVAASSVTESAGGADVIAILSAPSGREVRATLTRGGTAGADDAIVATTFTIAAGSTAAVVRITLTDDALDEDDETVELAIQSTDAAILGTPAMHIVTIRDDDSLPVVSLQPLPAEAGESGSLTITALLDHPSGRSVQVSVATMGTALAGSDFAVPQPVIVITSGASSGQTTIQLLDDTLVEGDETLIVSLTSPVNVALGTPGSATIRILDDDRPVHISFAEASSGLLEGADPSTIRIVLDAPAPRGVTAVIGLSGTALPGSDASVMPLTVMIPSGGTSTTVNVVVAQDAIFEGPESLVLSLTAIDGALGGDLLQHTVTIHDDDLAPVASFAATDLRVTESIGQATATLRLDRPVAQAVTVHLARSGSAGTTDAGAVPAEVTFPLGVTEVPITVAVLDDALPEDRETVILSIVSADGATFGPAAAWTLAIDDNDLLALVPVLEYVQPNGDGTATAFFGWDNRLTLAVALPAGARNQLSPAPEHQGQAVQFPPGRSGGWPTNAFSVPFLLPERSWRLVDTTVTADLSAPRPPVAPGRLDPALLPIVAISTPADQTFVDAGTALRVLVNAYDPDGRVVRVVLAVDGEPAATLVPVARAPLVADLGGLAIGVHALTAVATDDDGRTATSAVVTVTVRAVPTISLALAQPGVTLAGVDTTVTATVSPEVVAVSFQHDGTALIVDSEAPFAVTLAQLAAGPSRITATATTAQGASAVAKLDLYADLLPSVAISSPLSAAPVVADAAGIPILVVASDPDGRVVAVRVLVDGTVVGTATAAPWSVIWQPGAAVAGVLTAVAVDDLGAERTSAPVAITINSAPVVAITAPADGTIVARGAGIRVTAVATDADQGVAAMYIRNGADRIAESVSGSVSVEVPTPAAGDLVFTAEAIDRAGVMTNSLPIHVRVDAPPTILITAPAVGVTFGFAEAIAINATASDADGTIASTAVLVDGQVLVTGTNAAITATWTPTTGGFHQIALRAVDDQGGTTTRTVNVTVNFPPDLAWLGTAGTGAVDAGDRLGLSVSANDQDGTVATVTFAVDGLVVDAPTASPWQTTYIATAGDHVLTATARDDLGATTTITRQFHAREPVRVVLVSPTAGTAIESGVEVAIAATATAPAEGSITRLALRIDGIERHAVTQTDIAFTWTALPGSHVIQVVATDDRGRETSLGSAVAISGNVPPTVVAIGSSANAGGTVTAGLPLILTVDAADVDDGLAKVEVFAVEGDTRSLLTSLTTSGLSKRLAITVPAPPSGERVYVVVATDTRGAKGETPPWRLDADGLPSIIWLSPLPGTVVTVEEPFLVTIDAVDLEGVLRIDVLDGNDLVGQLVPPTGSASPWQVSTRVLGGGVRWLSARVIDSVGSVVPTPQVALFANRPPTVGLTSIFTERYDPAVGIELVATPSDPDGSIASVTFIDGETPIGTVTAPPWRLRWLGADERLHIIQAIATDDRGAQGVSPNKLTHRLLGFVSKRAVALAVSPGRLVAAGDPVTLTAAVSGFPSAIASVAFTDAGVALGSDSAAPFTLTTANLPVGTHLLTATASDVQGGTASSATMTLQVSDRPQVALSAPAPGAVLTLGQPVPLAVVASDADGIVQVRWMADGASIALRSRPTPDPATPFTATWQPSRSGPVVLTATAWDVHGFSTTSAAVEVLINAAPTVTLAVAEQAGGVLLTAQPADADGVVADVVFRSGDEVLATRQTSPWTYLWAHPPAGTHAVTATATDHRGASGLSPVQLITTGGNAGAPLVTLTSPRDGLRVAVGTPVTLSADASDPDGIATIIYHLGATPLATVAAQPYLATFTPTQPGTYAITALATDALGAQALSAAATITVNAPPFVGIASPGAGSVVPAGQPVEVLVQAEDADGTIATVTLLDGVAVLATRSAPPWLFSVVGMAPGPHALTARAVDSDGSESVSAVAGVIVNVPPTLALLAPTSGVLALGQSLSIVAEAADEGGRIAEVAFLIDGAVRATRSAAPWTAAIPELAAGAHLVEVRAVDDLGATATRSLTITVDHPPVVAITAPGAGATLVAGPTTVSVQAGDADGSVAQVALLVDGVAVAWDQAAPWSLPWTAAPGTHVLVAEATDDLGLTARSAAQTVLVNALPAVALTAPLAGASVVVGSVVTLAADATDADGAIVLVRFLADGQAVASATAKPWTANWTVTKERGYELIAEATDHAGAVVRSEPIAFTVRGAGSPPVVALTAPTASTVLFAGDDVPLAVTATDDGRIVSVLYGVDGFVADTVLHAPFAGVWRAATAGTHVIRVRADDDAGLKGWSAPLSVSVLPASQRPRVALTAPTAHQAVPLGQALELAAEVSAIVPVQRVTFLAGEQVLGSDDSEPFTLLWTPPALGALALTARVELTYADGSAASAVSASVPITVIPPDLTIVITAPVSGDILPPTSTTIAATVYNDTAPSVVRFFVDGVLLGSDSSEPFTQPWTPTIGTHTLTATVSDYSGEATSAPVLIAAAADSGLAPTVAFTDPSAAGSAIGFQAILGSVTSRNALAPISSWTLQWRRPQENDSQLRTIASGTTAVAAATLGVFDTTRIENGPVTLVLSARDRLGRTARADLRARIEGEAKPGQFGFSVQDVVIPVAGIPLTLTRTYSTLAKDRSADFGHGWTASFNDLQIVVNEERRSADFLQGNADGTATVRSGQGEWDVTMTLPDGRRTTFLSDISTLGGGGGGVYHDLGYSPAPGVDYGLRVDPPWAASLVILWPPAKPYWFGTQGWLYSPWRTYDLPGFSLTSQDGTKYIIARRDHGDSLFELNGEMHRHHVYGAPFLKAIVQPTGDTITFATDRVEHRDPTGVLTRQIRFVRDTAGRITRVYDPQAQEVDGTPREPATVVYRYSDSGDLTAVDHLEAVAEDGTPTYRSTIYGYADTRWPHYLTSTTDPGATAPTRMEYDENGRLTATVTPDGQRTTLAHDLSNRLETITDALGQQTVHGYDSRGNVTLTIDPLGNRTERTYDSAGHMLTESNALGNAITRTYDGRGNVLTEKDALNQTTTRTYDGRGNVLVMTDALGRTTTSTYNASGQVLTVTDAMGNITRFAYDAKNRLTTETDALGQVTQYSYDSAGNVGAITDALGNTTRFSYDSRGNQTSQVRYRRNESGQIETLTTMIAYDAAGRMTSMVGPDGAVTKSAYTARGELASTTDALGRTTNYEYDNQGRMLRVRAPDGTSTSMVYDAAGRRIRSFDAAGAATVFSYDKAGRLTTVTAPDGSTTKTAYDAAGQVETVTDARGAVTTFAYDDAGRRTGVTDPAGNLTETTYDAVGQMLTTTDAARQVTRFTYDALGRRTQTELADGKLLKTGYDAIGQRISETDQAGKITRFSYDALGRLVSVTDALGQVTQYGYDEIGQQIAQTDALLRTTKYAYDRAGRRTARVLPQGQREEMTYNIVGNLLTKKDFNGRTTTFTYDTRGRLLTTVPDASFGAATITRTYNDRGQRATMTDGTGTHTYSYDVRGRLTAEAKPQGTITYRYDSAGGLTEIAGAPTGVVGDSIKLAYTFDGAGRLASASGAGSAPIRYGYDNRNQVQHVWLPNGLHRTMGYDVVGRLTSQQTDLGGNPVASFAYTLDALGRKSSVTELSGRSIGWAYDDTQRLTAETIAGATLGGAARANGSISYGFDAVGNRLSRTSTLGAVANSAATYTANDWLAADQMDANGNTIVSAGGTDVYDFADHLIQRTKPDGTVVRITYDGDSVKVAEAVTPPGGSTTTTSFLVASQTPTGYNQTITQSVGGVVTKSYLWGIGLAPLAQQDGTGTVRWSITDGQGSVRALADVSGVVTDRTDYDAYGILIGRTGTTDCRYGYAGYEDLSVTGLTYLRARAYNSDSGRFWTMDIYEADLEEFGKIHKYIYTGNSPIDRVDPSGYFYNISSVMQAIINFGHQVRSTATTISRASTVSGALVKSLYTASVGLNILANGIDPRLTGAVALATPFCLSMVKRIQSTPNAQLAINVIKQAKGATSLVNFLLGQGLSNVIPGMGLKLNGLPDFTNHLAPGNGAVVWVPLSGSRATDKADAEGLRKSLGGPTLLPYTHAWHHNEVMGVMELVQTPFHKLGHVGGVLYYQLAFPGSYTN